jgi:hypothetical protein
LSAVRSPWRAAVSVSCCARFAVDQVLGLEAPLADERRDRAQAAEVDGRGHQDEVAQRQAPRGQQAQHATEAVAEQRHVV